MDTLLQTLLSWQFMLFSLSIAAAVYVLRTMAEYAMTKWQFAAKESGLWNNLLLPILPVFLGGASGVLFKTFPYPDGLTTTSSRLIFGIVAGLLSGLLYRVIKSLLFQKIQDVTNVVTPVVAPPVVTVATPVPPENALDDNTLNAQKQVDK